VTVLAGGDDPPGPPRVPSARADQGRPSRLAPADAGPHADPGMRSDALTTSEVLITAPRVILATAGREILEPGYVAVRAGVVTAVAPGPPPHGPDLALRTGVLLPGLVDLQVNGYFGVELMTAGADGWAKVVGRLPETGTTAFLPTFITAPPGQLGMALRAAAALVPGLPGRAARVLGVHAEGPFISPARKGDDLRTGATWTGGELVYSRTGDRLAGSATVTDGGSR
jgi:hypothetical protein